MKRSLAYLVGAGTFLCSIFGTALAYAGEDTRHAMSLPPAQGTTVDTSIQPSHVTTQTYHAAIRSNAFSPHIITVPAGTTVVWTNHDNTEHTVTGESTDGPASGQLQPGAVYKYTFYFSGKYYYHCSLHPSMTGLVLVTDTSAYLGWPQGTIAPTRSESQPSTSASDESAAGTSKTNTNMNRNTNINTNTTHVYTTVNPNESEQSTMSSETPPASSGSQPTENTETAETSPPAETTDTLPNTGAGDVISVVAAAMVVGGGTSLLYLRHRARLV